MYRSRFLLLIVSPLFVIVLLSCASGAVPKKDYGPVYFTDSVAYSLLPPEHIEKNMDMFQKISGVYGKNQFSINAWVQADSTGIVMELMNDLGAGVGTLSFKAGELDFTSSLFPKNIKVEYAVADFQLCFYKPDSLRPALGTLNLVTETDKEGTEKRFVYDGGTCIIEIEKTPQLMRYTNHARGYTYTIQGDFL